MTSLNTRRTLSSTRESITHKFSINGHEGYSYSCLSEVPEQGFVGVAYETVLPGSSIVGRASANNIVFTLVPQNFTNGTL